MEGIKKILRMLFLEIVIYIMVVLIYILQNHKIFMGTMIKEKILYIKICVEQEFMKWTNIHM